MNSCTKRAQAVTGASLIGMVALVLGLGFSHNALAVQASGAASIIPSDNSLEQDQLVDIRIRITNASSETGEDGDDDVPATYKAGGATTVLLACDSSTCTTELPGTLEFVPVGMTGCVANQPDVTCAEDGGNPNRVIISVGSDIVIPAGAAINLATFRAKAVTPVLNPADGTFFQRAQTGSNDLEAVSLVNPGPAVTGGAEGSTVYTFPGRCDVRVDKQISCDGGITWVDQGLVNANEDTTNGCQGLSNDQILVRYQVSNEGNLDAGQCVLTDVNSVGGMPFGDPADPGTIPAGSTSELIAGTASALCSEWEENEPNTATVTCNTCGGIARPGDPLLTAFDTATFSCLVADLLVDRAVACVDGVPAGFNDEVLVRADEDGTDGPTTVEGNLCQWKYQANNPGTAPLFACVLQDSNPDVTPAPILVGTLAPGEPRDIPAANQVECNDDLEANEVPGGRVDLACCTRNVESLLDCADDDRIQVYDLSTVNCVAPDLEVAKLCEVHSDTNEATFTVTATNTGEVDLVNCVATDTLRTGGLCPPSGDSIDQTLMPDAPFALDVGGQQVLTGGATITTDSCNFVSVTCQDAISGAYITGDATADCPFTPQEEGCLTRTPGFWGTHPDVTAKYLDLEVCGTTLNNVNAGNGHSAIEAMCSTGRDGRILGPQLTQLVRQCTSAALNIAASQDLGGNCNSDFPNIDATFSACCGGESICTGDTVGDHSVESCITALDFFNNTDPDTLSFDFPVGRAMPRACQDSRNNGIVVSPGQD
ncbi:hypothetical protein [Nitrosomonas sp. ANs5]|uniref:hypothetical protein n=1 Tax=Nitrosomonas sp. ANs5 TaxID=3423941 RepID=UPI003D358A10